MEKSENPFNPLHLLGEQILGTQTLPKNLGLKEKAPNPKLATPTLSHLKGFKKEALTLTRKKGA